LLALASILVPAGADSPDQISVQAQERRKQQVVMCQGKSMGVQGSRMRHVLTGQVTTVMFRIAVQPD